MSVVKPTLANPPERRVTEATRIPMSVPTLKLEVPDIPGFHLHWVLGERVPRALRAGYSFVEEGEVDTNNFDVAGSAGTSGSSDLGSKISQLAGGISEQTNQPQRLYLMKLPQEWWDKDQAARDEVNEQVASRLRAGMEGAETDPDRAMRYLKEGQTMFVPRKARGRLA